MIHLNPIKSMMILNINGLNAQLKSRDCYIELKTWDATICFQKKIHFKYKNINK